MLNLSLKHIFMWAALFLIVMVPSALSQVTSYGGEREYPSWDGVWNTNYGRMELGQDGSDVFGTYESDEGDGTITGTVSENVLTYTWTLNTGYDESSGPGELTISPDGLSFTGWWSFEYDNKTHYEWTGSKVEDREITGELPDVDYIFWRGAWDTKGGIMVFEQDLESSDISGMFEVSGGLYKFEGTASGWEADFEITGDTRNGTGHVELEQSLNTFTGTLQFDGETEPIELTGTFFSGDIRENFSGTWDMNEGAMTIVQADSGDVTGSISGVSYGGATVDLEIKGVVLGPVLLFEWTLADGSTQTEGFGKFTISDDGDRIEGYWTASEDPELTAKVTGVRG